MGWIKDAKADRIGAEAARGIEEGRRIFVARINTPATHHALSGSLPGFAEQIEAVESLGWSLAEMSFAQDSKGKPEGYFLFRR